MFMRDPKKAGASGNDTLNPKPKPEALNGYDRDGPTCDLILGLGFRVLGFRVVLYLFRLGRVVVFRRSYRV